MPSALLGWRSIIRTVRVTRANTLGGAKLGSDETPDTSRSVRLANWMLSSSHGTIAEPVSPAQAREISEESSRTGGRRSTGKYNFAERNPVSAAILSKQSAE